MGRSVVSFRLDDGLRGWVAEYAAKRGVAKTEIFEAAVREFRGACGGGVPDLPAPVVGTATVHSASRRVDTVDEARRWALARQAKLNVAKERSR